MSVKQPGNNIVPKYNRANYDLNYILDCIGQGIRIIDTHFTVQYINKAFAELSGVIPAQAVGKRCWEVFPSPACHTPNCRLQRILGGESMVRSDMNRGNREGVSIPCAVSAIPLRNPNGELLGIVESFRDITEPSQLRTQIKEVEEEYRALIELSAEMGESIVVLQDIEGIEGIQVFVNDQWPKTTGYKKEELLGMPFFDLLATDERPLSLLRHRRKMAGQCIPGLFEMTLIRRDKSVVNIELTGACTIYQGKRANVLYIRDVTDRKRIIQQMNETEAHYNALVELGSQIGAGVMVLQDVEGVEGKHVFVSDQWVRMTGYSREELLSMSNFDLFPPNQRAFLIEGHRHRNEGPKHTSELWEMSIIRKDGTVIPIETEGALTTYQGDPAVVVYIRDISERKKMEKILKDSENLYRTIFETSGTAMHILDEDGTTSLVNEEFETLYGWTKKQSIGKYYTELVAPKYRGQATSLFNKRKVDPKSLPKKNETQIMDSSGKIKDTLVAISMIPGTEKRVISQLDITDLKNFEKRLNHSKMQLGRLARRIISAQEIEHASIARELHDQLAQDIVAIRMEASLLRDRSDNVAVRSKLDELVGSITGLIRTVQNISKDLRPQVLDNLGLVNAIQFYAEEFERRTSISCPVNVQDGMLQKMVVNKETVTEAYRIVQEALGNVFRHAKATQAKISISLKNDKLFISVQDNGVGIQVNRLDDKSALGILGMRERASIVGGTIRIASNPGKGTTVRISIPL